MTGRRDLLAAVAATAALPAGGARAGLLPGATALVPGPERGDLARWAVRVGAALARGTDAPAALSLEVLGGPDGVTAANRFATAAAPDGRTLLVLPGATAMARLVGDPRARFDPAGWLPVCASGGAAVVAGRGPPPAAANPAAPLRLALAAADSAEAAALLAFDLLRLPAQPLLGLAPAQAEAALAAGAADVVVLPDAAALARLAPAGARPWFTLDLVRPAAREPLPLGVPSLAELLGEAPAPLRAACAAAAAAARLRAALVLPALTPAELVAGWRGTTARWVEQERGIPGALPVPGAEAAALLAALAPSREATRAYRDWLRQRLGWQAG